MRFSRMRRPPAPGRLELSCGGRQVVVAHRSYSPWLNGIAPRTSFVFGSTTPRCSNAGPRPASGFSDRAIGAACYGKSAAAAAASRRLSVVEVRDDGIQIPAGGGTVLAV